jgi:hypothetical protein
MVAPDNPKIYHILHVDRLASVIADGLLYSDAELLKRPRLGTAIGMSSIKQRRLGLGIDCRPGLCVGQCVPFYFCPRSIMLYLLHCSNHEELAYRGGQGPIVHIECNLYDVVQWADQNRRRWAFTLSNAGAYYCESRCDLGQLNEINWASVQTDRWAGNGISRSVKEGKQAEFLVEHSFPWSLVRRIGIHDRSVAQQVADAMVGTAHRPTVEVKTSWYY